MVEGAKLQMRPHRTRPSSQRTERLQQPPPQSRLHGAGLASQAFITPEYKTGGVISYCRAEAMLPAAWLSLGPRGGSVTASHLTQVTGVQKWGARCPGGSLDKHPFFAASDTWFIFSLQSRSGTGKNS